eukprot:gene21032-1521_t
MMRHLPLWVLLVGHCSSTEANTCGSNATYHNSVAYEACECQADMVCEGTNSVVAGAAAAGVVVLAIVAIAAAAVWKQRRVEGAGAAGGAAARRARAAPPPANLVVNAAYIN